MKFGQALEAILNGTLVTRSGWNRQGMKLGLQAPTGRITQPFIYRQLANGETRVWCPDQADMLATDWQAVAETNQPATERQHEHVVA